MRSALTAALVLITAACGGPDGIPFGSSDTCDARSQRSLVGQTVENRALLTLAAPKVRMIEQGDRVAQDDQPDRLNIVFGANEEIVRVYCG